MHQTLLPEEESWKHSGTHSLVWPTGAVRACLIHRTNAPCICFLPCWCLLIYVITYTRTLFALCCMDQDVMRSRDVIIVVCLFVCLFLCLFRALSQPCRSARVAQEDNDDWWRGKATLKWRSWPIVMEPLQNLPGKNEGGDYSGSGRPDTANLKQQTCHFPKPPRSVVSILKKISRYPVHDCRRDVQRGVSTASRHLMGCSRAICVLLVCLYVWV